MNAYFKYWRRGWWAWLLALCLNFSLFPLIVPAAIAFAERPALYAVACLVLWVLIGAPVWGWLFEVFARNSTPVASPQAMGSDPTAADDAKQTSVQPDH